MPGFASFAFLFALVTAVLGLPVKALAADSAPAMITPGKFGVGAAGAFTYDIPIAVPPGTAGMSPALSLDYSSQSGDGILGMGWVLGGLPSVARCPRTIAQDGVHGGINYDLNDRFCMDGQRLIVTSGTYGADGSKYRTEIDGFSLIIAHGSTGNGPTWFEVHTKSGEIMELGNTSDSRSPAVGKTTIRAWAVDKISDTVGNYYTVSYTVDAANGVNYPARIDYTGNAAASLSTYNSIRFVYESRTDITPFYQAGSLTQRTQLLKDVQTYAGATLVSDYQLTYQPGTSTRHSELLSIAQCDGNNVCLPATSFGWQGSRDDPAMTALPNSAFQGTETALRPGAFSGLGLTDLYVVDIASNICGVFYGTQTAGVFIDGHMTATYSQYQYDPDTHQYFVVPVVNGPLPCPSLSFQFRNIVDMTGDGLSDGFVGQKVSQSETDLFSLVNNGANGLIQPENSSGGVTPITSPEFGDFNGDGRVDLLGTLGGTTSAYMFIGDGIGNFNQTGSALPQAGYFPADFDGDGCTDILETGVSGGATSQVVFSCAPAVASVVTPSLANIADVVPGDFNGDGKTDLLVVPVSGNAQVYLSTGTGFSAPYTIANSSDWNKYQIQTGDWNGDGRTDVVLIADGASGHHGVGTSHKLYLSTGTGFGSEWQDIPNLDGHDTTVNMVVADLNNDGAADIWLQKPSGDTEYMFSYIPELIHTVSNGIGVTTTVNYDRLNHATLYTKESGDAYPTQDMNGPFYVVASINSSNGIGGNYGSSYSYSGAKTDLQGRGFLGFHTMSVTDTQTNIVQTTTYDQTFPYTALALSQTKMLGGVTINATFNSYAATASVSGAAAQFVYLTKTTAQSTDLDGTVMPTVVTTYGTYDAYGNPQQITVTTGGSTKVSNNTYTNDTTNWFLGRLTQSSVTSTVGSSTIMRTSSFAYDPGTGLLDKEIVEPATPALKLQTVYGFDSFGNKQTATVTGGSGASLIASRTTTTDYDTRGQFATTVVNALNQSETWTYDLRFAHAASHTGPNSQMTHWVYDTFGRASLETRPDGTQTSYAYAYCSGVNGGTASCPANGAFLVQTKMFQTDGVTQNGPTATTYYDALSRVIAHDVQGFDGTVIRTDSQYDAWGRPYQTSLPYFFGVGSAHFVVNAFDTLGRVTSTTRPDDPQHDVTTYAYDGLTTSVTDPNSNTTTTVKNAQGLNASVTDANGKITRYVYDAFGDLLTITDSAGNVTSAVYDTRGNRTTAADPDKGTWTYTCDALGELKTQTNANGNKATLYYDLLGRITRRAETGLNSTWNYDTAANGIGALAEADTNGGYSRVMTYDTHARPSTTTLSFGGNSAIYTTSYDTQTGKVSKVAYPSGMAISYAYNGVGYLNQMTTGSGVAVWSVSARDQFLNAVSETAGNGVVTTHSYNALTGRVSQIEAGTSGAVADFTYQFDLVGNLLARHDHDLSTSDAFTYDTLNRLSTYSIGGGAYQTMGYDSLGDIKTKPGVGTYHYPAAGGERPHAVSSITGTVRGVINPRFTYDGDGNQLSGPGVAVGYTSWDMPAWMSAEQGGTTWGSFNWGAAPWNFTGETFKYGSEHQRVEMTAQAGSTFYFNDPASGGTAEYYVPATGAAQWREYIVADGRMVAERVLTVGGSSALQYFVGDHLGSIAVITDASGNVVQRMVYDPWGVQLASDGSQLCGAGPTTRGYTGEEQLPTGCLVNLNARFYDPILGRFMSGDPVTGNIYDAQTLNRYGYVLNNPLSMTDTNGQCPICLGILFGVLFDVATVELLKPIFEHVPLLGDLYIIASGIACGPAAALCAAEAAGALAGVESGSVGKGLKAFVLTFVEAEAFKGLGHGLQTAGISAASPTAFVASGLVGGTFSVLHGGSFGSGFLSAGFADLASPYVDQGNRAVGALESAVVGGTASVIGGGKFGDGALTAAFDYLGRSLQAELRSGGALMGRETGHDAAATLALFPGVESCGNSLCGDIPYNCGGSDCSAALDKLQTFIANMSFNLSLSRASTWQILGSWVGIGEVLTLNFHDALYVNGAIVYGDATGGTMNLYGTTWQDYSAIINHEFLHILGLWHNNEPGTLMYQYFSPSTSSMPQPGERTNLINAYPHG